MTAVKSKLLRTTALKGPKGNALFLLLLLISAGGKVLPLNSKCNRKS